MHSCAYSQGTTTQRLPASVSNAAMGSFSCELSSPNAAVLWSFRGAVRSALDGAHGTSSGGRIQILSSLAPAAEFGVLVHEYAHLCVGIGYV